MQGFQKSFSEVIECAGLTASSDNSNHGSQQNSNSCNEISGENFCNYLRNFDRVGRDTQEFVKNDVTYFVNDFWTAKQRQSNRIHEISYRACFKAELPAFFIESLTNPGDLVLDPFMGRGTTLVQANLLGRVPYGNDISPLSKMLVAPRLSPPSMQQIKERLEVLEREFDQIEDIQVDDDLLVFFHPKTLKDISKLRDWFIQGTANGNLDAVDSWIRMVALNRLTGHSAGFFSVYTLPPNQATTVDRQKKINAKRNQTPEEKDIFSIILKKSKSLLSQYDYSHSTDVFGLSTGSASQLESIDNNLVSLIVTSPPFLDVVDYAKDNWLRAWFAGFSIDDVEISIHKKVEDWTAFARECFIEFGRILKPGGFIAFEVGEVRNGSILLEDLVIEAIEGLNFKVHGVMINDQKFFKTSNSWGVSNNSKGTNTNRIVIVEKV
ncbi:MAG: DNA methyltransferase [Hellea sp.]